MRSKRNSGIEGIEVRHSRACSLNNGGERCSCKPSYQAQVYDRRSGKPIKRTFADAAAAKGWRDEARVKLRKGTMQPPNRQTLREAADAFLAGIESGATTEKRGHAYKPSTIRGYRDALERRILPDLGHERLSEVTRNQVQDLADNLRAEKGLSASSVHNALMPLRCIYRRAISRGEVTINPTANLDLPAARGRRARIADPGEGTALLAVLEPADRALWGTAMYAGLRLGELRALRWEDVDLAAGVIRIERSWDEKSKEPGETKGREARKVGLIPALRDLLVEHKLSQGRSSGLVFPGSKADRPFTPSAVRKRAYKRWDKAGLKRLSPHEARHTFASLMIASGANAKAIQALMGHKSIELTFDLYGHLMPGAESEAADLLDAYLRRADTQGRLEQLEAA